MSPCTAKLSAYRSKHVMKYVPLLFSSLLATRSNALTISRAKPKSLFAKASSKNFESTNMFADKPSEPKPDVEMQ
jgi:hypothetical protein